MGVSGVYVSCRIVLLFSGNYIPDLARIVCGFCVETMVGACYGYLTALFFGVS